MGAVRVLAENRNAWQGTLFAVFQPGEETAQGAKAMIQDGLVKRFPKPDVTMAQHLVPAPAGSIGWSPGTVMAAGDSWEVTLFGRGAHGSMPQKGIDTVLMASSAVMRLQGVVSARSRRRMRPSLRWGRCRPGARERHSRSRAASPEYQNLREHVRSRVLAAIRRILDAEAAASGAPKSPGYAVLSEFPRTDNEAPQCAKLLRRSSSDFGQAVQQIQAGTASEISACSVRPGTYPVVYWVIGCLDPDRFAAAVRPELSTQLPVNHAPDFAPVLDPTLRTGVAAMVTAASVWLDCDSASMRPRTRPRT